MVLAKETCAMIGLQDGVPRLLSQVLDPSTNGSHLRLTVTVWMALNVPVGIVVLRVVKRGGIGGFSRVRGEVGRFSGDERRVDSEKLDWEGVIGRGCAKGLESNGSFGFIEEGKIGIRGRKLSIVMVKNRTSTEPKEQEEQEGEQHTASAIMAKVANHIARIIMMLRMMTDSRSRRRCGSVACKSDVRKEERRKSLDCQVRSKTVGRRKKREPSDRGKKVLLIAQSEVFEIMHALHINSRSPAAAAFTDKIIVS
jgi:hypothetical protein